MFQISYFSSKAPRERKVCIAKYPPRFWKGPRASKLAPSDIKTPNWREAYRADLEERFPGGEGLLDYLQGIAAQTPNPILCCYESDPGQCHRRVLAAYIKETLGMDVPEWDGGQGNLFTFGR